MRKEVMGDINSSGRSSEVRRQGKKRRHLGSQIGFKKRKDERVDSDTKEKQRDGK